MSVDHEPAGSPVTTVRRESRGPSAGFALIAVVAAVVAAIVIAVASGPGPQPVPSPSSVALATASSAPSDTIGSPSPTAASAAPTRSPIPDATTTVVVLRGVTDPASELAALTGCTENTRITGYPVQLAIKGPTVDSVAGSAGRTTGWLFVPPGIQASTRVWLGTDLVDLALAVGQQVVAVSPKGEVWLGGPSGATRWYSIATPKGLTAWVMGADGLVGSGICNPWIVPALIGRQRSLTCSGVGVPGCLEVLAQAQAEMSGLLYANGDALASLPCIGNSPDCVETPAVVAAPADWTGTLSELRAAAPLMPGGPFAAAGPDLLPDRVLDALARPALALPTGGERARDNSCAETFAGQLHASPWDPRVAWAGDMRVVWPTGTRVRFIPFAVVDTPGSENSKQAELYDPVVITGMLDDTGMVFDACSWTLGTGSVGAPGAVGEVPSVTPGPIAGRGTGG